MEQFGISIRQHKNGNWVVKAPELGLIAVQGSKEEAKKDLELILGPTSEFIKENSIPVAKTDLAPYNAKYGFAAIQYVTPEQAQTCLLNALRTIDNSLANKLNGVIVPRTKKIKFYDGFFLYDLKKPTRKIAFSFDVLRAGEKYAISFRFKADKAVLREIAAALSKENFDCYARRKDDIFA